MPSSLDAPVDLSLVATFLHAALVVQITMGILLLASIATWTILVAKGIGQLMGHRHLRQALRAADSADSLGALRLLSQMPPIGIMLGAVTKELECSAGLAASGTGERVAICLRRVEIGLARRMARGIGTLATIGAIAPFVGLFGTVWGIMNSFTGIAQMHTAGLAAVAPGIAEALLATATGLLAAIPAVIVYNGLSRAVGAYRVGLGDLGACVMRTVGRDLARRDVAAPGRSGRFLAAE